MPASVQPIAASVGNASRAATDLGLAVSGVTFAYGRKSPVLENVSLEVPDGEIHCLLGPSGAGKSTLLKLIAGLERPLSGSISIRGREVFGRNQVVPTERRRIGLVFQDFRLFPHLDALRNVMFGMASGPRRDRKRRAAELLDCLGLRSESSSAPHELSGGQQQRVAVARALATGPQLMLLDEPFRSLDDETRMATRQCVLETLRLHRITTLVVTHDGVESNQMGDRSWKLESACVQSSDCDT